MILRRRQTKLDKTNPFKYKLFSIIRETFGKTKILTALWAEEARKSHSIDQHKPSHLMRNTRKTSTGTLVPRKLLSGSKALKWLLKVKILTSHIRFWNKMRMELTLISKSISSRNRSRWFPKLLKKAMSEMTMPFPAKATNTSPQKNLKWGRIHALDVNETKICK